MEINISEEEIREFQNEATELLDEAEQSILSLGSNPLSHSYDAIFRVFHSVKGGAGMLGLAALLSHMHQLESHFQSCKALPRLSDDQTNYFLKGIDAAKALLKGQTISFDYSSFSIASTASSSETLKPPSSAPLTSVQSSVSASFSADGSKVVIIDDEVDLLDALSDILKEANFEVFQFNSPTMAIENIPKIKPDVVLTDFTMPDLNGLQVLKKVNEIDPNIPVIFLSGYISKEIILKSLEHGVFSAIEKPFKEEDVIFKCKNAAERHKIVKLLFRTIEFLYFQFADLDDYLKTRGPEEVRKQMHAEFRALIEAKRKLKFIKKP